MGMGLVSLLLEARGASDVFFLFSVMLYGDWRTLDI